MTKKRLLGSSLLVALAAGWCVVAVYRQGDDITGQFLLFSAVVAAFGLYTFGALFFDYPVTFRTTIRPSDPTAMRVFQAGIGFLLWMAAVWGLLR